MLKKELKLFCSGGGEERSQGEKDKEPSPIKHQKKEDGK